MLFTPRHIKEGKHYRHALKRLIHYKEDILKPEQLATLRELLAKLNVALKTGRREDIGLVQDEIEQKVGKIAPPPSNSSLRENVEVFVVAIVVAAGVRAFFLQPFKIPTGSMQPTLYGIVGEKMETPPPNIAQRVFEFAWLGRSYFDLVATDDDVIVSLRERTHLNFFTFTEITAEKKSYSIFAPAATLAQYFGLRPGTVIRKGQPIVRGYVDTGDQVFVDKMSYNFLTPKDGNVFVFKTAGIHGLPPGQHYIKRLAGSPGDTLRLASPKLYINGEIAPGPAFAKVMSEENGYRGYANAGSYLGNPDDQLKIADDSYFALGDNSYNSLDSRYWGFVPEQNVAGRGLFVYWPFSKRWGLIR